MNDRHDKSGGFLRRWSRRKQAASRSRQLDTATVSGGSESEITTGNIDADMPLDDTSVAPVNDQNNRDLLTDADMPDVESLDEHSDYSQFFSQQVSDELRQAALRKLFHLPGLNKVDGLDDYDEDFNLATTLMASLRDGLTPTIGKDQSVTTKNLDRAESSKQEREVSGETSEDVTAIPETHPVSMADNNQDAERTLPAQAHHRDSEDKVS